MNAVIRNYQVSDKAQVDAVALAAFGQYAHEYKDWEGFFKKIANLSKLADSFELFVAEMDSKIVGAVVYVRPNQPRADFFKPEWAIIRMLVVLPEARGKGIGRALTEKCLDCAKRDRVETVALHTSKIMQVALAMYLKMGFVFHAAVPDIHGVRYKVYVKPLLTT